MASEDAIAAKVLEDLKDGPHACSSLTRLSGGNTNFIYRGILQCPLPDKTSTIIIKHAESHIAKIPSWEFDVARSYYEQYMLTALETFKPTFYSNIHVTTPSLYKYSSNAGNQILSDYPNFIELKNYFTTHPISSTQATRLGIALGTWLKSFHVWAAEDAQRPLREVMKKNEPMVQLKFMINFGRLMPTIDRFPAILEESRKIFKNIEQMMREEIGKGEGELIHGDFWSCNFLLQEGPLPPESSLLKIVIIDWEMSRLSSLDFDLGHCFAELYLLTHFRSVKAGAKCISAFMAGYGPLDEDVAFRVALHFGAHLLVWPWRVEGWGEGEVMDECIRMGRDYCTHAYRKDIEFFRGGVLDRVFFSGT